MDLREGIMHLAADMAGRLSWDHYFVVGIMHLAVAGRLSWDHYFSRNSRYCAYVTISPVTPAGSVIRNTVPSPGRELADTVPRYLSAR